MCICEQNVNFDYTNSRYINPLILDSYICRLMKKIISIFLIIIISIQCLPVKELGKCIFESSFIEEDICDKSLEKKEGNDFLKGFFIEEYNIEQIASTTGDYYTENIDLYQSPVADQSIQPPNT